MIQIDPVWYTAKKYISWSGGKDSTATIILAHEHNIPVDDICYVEVMYDKSREISGDDFEQVEWIHDVAIPKIKSFGYNVTVLRSDKDFLDCFYYKIKFSKNGRNGQIHGFPSPRGCNILRDCKQRPISQYRRTHKDYLSVIGIAADEPDRLPLDKTINRSLLAELGYTERMARDLCEKYDLLSPLYASANRGGCWFCPNQHTNSRCKFRKEHPELWAEFEALEKVPNQARRIFSKNKTLSEIVKEMDEYDSQQWLKF